MMRKPIQMESFFPGILDSIFDGLYIVDNDRKILYWNKAAEEITGYSREEMEGRFCYDNILQRIDNEGRQLCMGGCPMVSSINNGEAKKVEVFFHHKTGHRVPIQVRITPIRGAEGQIVGAVEIFNENFFRLQAEQRIRELENKALRDPLTGLFNRYYGIEKIETLLRKYEKMGDSFGIIFIDVDNFKSINDQRGHAVGDEVLKALARTLKENIRFKDIAVRWGGEEFVLILQETQRETVGALAEKFLNLIRSTVVHSGDQKLHFTASSGATAVLPGDTAAIIVDRADQLMYESKMSGKNRNTLS